MDKQVDINRNEKQDCLFNKIIERYESRNEDLLNRLDTLHHTIEEMESTAPNVIFQYLLETTQAPRNLDLHGMISDMCEARTSKPDLKVSEDDIMAALKSIGSDDSIDSQGLIQLIRLQTILREENLLKEKLNRMEDREQKALKTFSEMAQTGDPAVRNLANDLLRTLAKVENCQYCKDFVSSELRATVEGLSKALILSCDIDLKSDPIRCSAPKSPTPQENLLSESFKNVCSPYIPLDDLDSIGGKPEGFEGYEWCPAAVGCCLIPNCKVCRH